MLLLLAHCLLITVVFQNRRLLAISGNLFLSVESALPLAVALFATHRMGRGDPRYKSMFVLTLAFLFNALAHASWTGLVIARRTPQPPSPPDLFFALFYLTFVVGIALHPAATRASFTRTRLVLELAAAFLAAGLLFWAFGIAPIYGPDLGGILMRRLAVLYPASAAALFAALMFFLRNRVPGLSRTAMILLWLGAAARLLNDAVFSYQLVAGTYVDGGYGDLGYSVSAICFALGLLRQWQYSNEYRADEANSTLDSEGVALVPWNEFVPQVGLITAFGLLVWMYFNPSMLNFSVVAITSGLILALLMAREVIAFKEIETLYARERELVAGLRRGHDELERRVHERTAELEKANEALVEHAAKLEQARMDAQVSLVEKEALLQEVHHRVKNNLQVVSSLLSLQWRSTKDSRAAAALLESQARLRTMALIHEKLYRSADLTRINFGDYLHCLLDHLITLYAPNPLKATIQIEVEPVPLSLDAAVPCGLIINELVSNAFKHAFPGARQGTISIGLHELGNGRLELSVVDDGIGLPAEIEVDRSRTLGLKLVASLTRQIEGELDIDRATGTAYRLRFKPGSSSPTISAAVELVACSGSGGRATEDAKRTGLHRRPGPSSFS